ncbi:hypothetical protein [Geitlerinema calcuttense]|uniref:Uncharacterized protein n=1 Tax=Geitlerinema calcuttense NRMC-F 0142 TaxID=2922238 RepID=A0ABT7M1U1_9CYAN|nr:hypothetical protein [Geitlerinema calcuttense]MCD8485519.1 hypothetical protein [Desertifilum sp.]MDL5057812.1 hypothetical protein [Geitlerinema calcuttense NRMC-F 0142]
MRLFKKLAAGVLLSAGCVLLLAVAVDRLDEMDEEETPIAAIVTALALAVPAIASGGAILKQLHRDRQQAERDRLQSTFYHLLEANNGRLTVLRLAMAANLPAATARQYLDENAKCFNAEFEPLDNGDIAYQFYL